MPLPASILSFDAVQSTITKIEHSTNVGHLKGKSSSPILDGKDTPEFPVAPYPTLEAGRLRAGINTPRTRTDVLKRKYAASNPGTTHPTRPKKGDEPATRSKKGRGTGYGSFSSPKSQRAE